MSFKLIFALAAIGCLKGSAASPGVITCKCTGPGCGTDDSGVEDPAACECSNIVDKPCKITVMNQDSPQAETFLTCEGPGCECKAHGDDCECRSKNGSWALDRPIECTTGINSTEWTVSGDRYVICGLTISGAQVSKPFIFGMGPDIASDETFRCRPADAAEITMSCIWETSPVETSLVAKAYCTAENPECEIMSVANPSVYCKGKGCIATKASDGVLTVSSTEKDAVAKFADSLICRNPTDRDGDCRCSNEKDGTCYSSRDKGEVTILGDPDCHAFASGCTMHRHFWN